MGFLNAIIAFAMITFVSSLAPKSVLIVQNKGGGHGEVGFSLAKNLVNAKHAVTILQDSSADMNAQPFCEYSKLEGVTIVSKKLKEVSQLTEFLGSGLKYDAVIDNNSKDVEQASAIASAVKTYGPDSQYIYISSGGMYKGDMPEGGYIEACCQTKDDNGCRIIEKYLEEQDIKWTSFRPQYIYGDNTNKRINMDWFFDRIVRDRVVPIPGDGTQMVALSHVDDVASIIAAAVGNEKAHKQVFNCGTDKFVSYNSLCKAIAKAASFSNPRITYYDPKKLDSKPSFPFRATTFTLDPTKAKTELGWGGSTHKLLTMVRKNKNQEPAKGDVMIWYEQYVAMGLDKTPFDSTEDDAIVNSLNRVA